MRRFGILLGALALAGCVVGPNYRAPETPPPAAFGETPPDLAAGGVDLAGWWHAYRDPELDRLIAIALQESPNIGIATARIAQARAQVRAARSLYFPEIDATGNVNHQKISKNSGLSSLASVFGGGGGGTTGGSSTGGSSSSSSSGIGIPGNTITTYSLGFDATWELDLFGGVHRQVEGARARQENAVWNARDAQLTLIGDVADAYLQLRTDQEREGLARAEVDRQTRNLKIMADTAKAGLLPQGDYIRQRAQLATAQAAVGPIVADGKAQMHALGVLLGRTPDALITELSVERPQLGPPPVVPPGLPADLLRRRPDVRAAERNLAAATADIGVAVADLFPRITLTGMAELLSTALGNLLTGDSLQLSQVAQGVFPVLDFGNRRAQVSLRKAQADEQYYTYRQTVLTALRDVEDALIRIRTEVDREAALKAGVGDAALGVQAVEARYASGLVDFGEVLNARQSLIQSQDQLAQSDGLLRRDLLSLYKALGGGWEGLALPDAKPGAALSAYTKPKAK